MHVPCILHALLLLQMLFRVLVKSARSKAMTRELLLCVVCGHAAADAVTERLAI